MYFNQIADETTLHQALEKILKKGSAGGLDGMKTGDLSTKEASALTAELNQELMAGKYVPIPYGRTSMPKFNASNEWRKLSLPAIRDKVVQQAFVQVVAPVFERHFYDCSYAYRPGKGHFKAIKRVEHLLRTQKALWAVPLDIDNFFDTLDHKLLLTKIAWEINEQEILNLVKLWMESGSIGRKGEWLESDEGIAQGSVVSPLFSNIYLHDLDELAVKFDYSYVRYSDNIIVLTKSKEDAYEVLERLQGFLERELRLRFNDNPYPFKSLEKGFVFLGVYFQNDLRKIATAKETKIFRKLNWLTDKYRHSNPEVCLKKINESIAGTRRYYGFLNPVDQFQQFDQHLFKRLKFLLSHFILKKLLPERTDWKTFFSGIEMYSSTSEEEKEKLIKDLIREVHELAGISKKHKPDQKSTTEAVNPSSPAKPIVSSSQAKRGTGQKNRYLRKVAEQSEVTISNHGVFLGKTSNRLVIKEQRRNIDEFPFSKLSNVSINSRGVTLSSDLIFQCAKSKIPIAFYTINGQPFAVLQSPIHSMGETSVLQVKAYETQKGLDLAKNIVSAKSKNQMNLLKFYLRSRKSVSDFADRVNDNLHFMQEKLSSVNSIQLESPYSLTRDKLMTTEANISRKYWEGIKILLPEEMEFTGRQRRGSRDVVNQMLNYGYGILYQRVWNMVLKSGLNPHISFLHAFQQHKPTLVYDLVEEFRQPFVDRAIFSLITKGTTWKRLKITSESQLLNDETRNLVIKAVLGRLSGLISFRRKKLKGEDIIEHQVRNVVSFLKDINGYKPFIAGY